MSSLKALFVAAFVVSTAQAAPGDFHLLRPQILFSTLDAPYPTMFGINLGVVVAERVRARGGFGLMAFEHPLSLGAQLDVYLARHRYSDDHEARGFIGVGSRRYEYVEIALFETPATQHFRDEFMSVGLEVKLKHVLIGGQLNYRLNEHPEGDEHARLGLGLFLGGEF